MAWVLAPALVAAGPAACGPAPGPDDPDAQAVVDWVAEALIPLAGVEPGQGFEDLEPLRGVVGEARVVLLGESRHDAREHFQLKHRLFEFLVVELGFTRFALEESVPCAEAIDAWILGGEGDPAALLTGLGGWFIWDTEEVLDLVRWMRAYNADPEHRRKVRFHGLDITAPRAGIEDVIAFLERVDPEVAGARLRDELGVELHDPLAWDRTVARYAALSRDRIVDLDQAWERLLSHLEERRAAHVAQASAAEVERVHRLALVGQRAHALFRAAAHGTFEEAGDVRERAMADNLAWILEQADANERVVVWAHDFHVARHTLDLDVPERPPARGVAPMGQYAGEALGERMLSVGFTFDRGRSREGRLPPAAPGTLDAVLARVGEPRFLVDLRDAPAGGNASHWLAAPRRMRGQGGTATLLPARAFDALVFVEEVGPTRPTAGARARVEALRER